MDRSGRLVISTLPSGLDAALLDEIGHQVIHAFKSARAAHLPLSELNIQYRSLKITARDLAGGAFVFFTPITPISTNPLN